MFQLTEVRILQQTNARFDQRKNKDTKSALHVLRQYGYIRLYRYFYGV